jgi:hypothetical protein
MHRPQYPLGLKINGRVFSQVVIDQHYRISHPEMTDKMILNLVKELSGQDFPIEITKGDYEYIRVEPVFYDSKPYRLILLLCAVSDFVGVVNAFRVN